MIGQFVFLKRIINRQREWEIGQSPEGHQLIGIGEEQRPFLTSVIDRSDRKLQIKVQIERQ